MNPPVSLLFLLCSTVCADNWPEWRGPERTGVAHEERLPEKWSSTENVRWRTPLPESGNSTPIVWKDRVFLTQTDGARRTVICIDRATGKVVWQQGPSFPEKEPTHETNPQSSSS